MKSSTVACLATILLSLVVFAGKLKAQDAPTSPGAAPRHHPHFLEELGLSEAQKAEIKRIRESTPKGKQRHEAIMRVLTQEQRAQLKQDIEAWKANPQ